jgi:hypothetical protein
MKQPRKDRLNSSFASAEIAIYDGLRRIGAYSPCKAGFAAYDQRGRGVGVFATKDLARLAILAAQKNAGAQP